MMLFFYLSPRFKHDIDAGPENRDAVVIVYLCVVPGGSAVGHNHDIRSGGLEFEKHLLMPLCPNIKNK